MQLNKQLSKHFTKSIFFEDCVNSLKGDSDWKHYQSERDYRECHVFYHKDGTYRIELMPSWGDGIRYAWITIYHDDATMGSDWYPKYSPEKICDLSTIPREKWDQAERDKKLQQHLRWMQEKKERERAKAKAAIERDAKITLEQIAKIAAELERGIDSSFHTDSANKNYIDGKPENDSQTIFERFLKR